MDTHPMLKARVTMRAMKSAVRMMERNTFRKVDMVIGDWL